MNVVRVAGRACNNPHIGRARLTRESQRFGVVAQSILRERKLPQPRGVIGDQCGAGLSRTHQLVLQPERLILNVLHDIFRHDGKQPESVGEIENQGIRGFRRRAQRPLRAVALGLGGLLSCFCDLARLGR